MNMIKKLFPKVMQANDVKGLLIAILIYVIIHLVGGLALGLLDNIPLVGFVFGVLGLVLSIYCAAGIIIAILVFLKIVK